MEVPAEIRRAMVAHAAFCLPDEACGLLAADAAGLLRMTYRALRHAEARGWHLAGVFHSHPGGPAYPSPTDIAQALEPEWLYVVVGLQAPAAPEVRAFWIRDGVVVEETVREVAGEAAEALR